MRNKSTVALDERNREKVLEYKRAWNSRNKDKVREMNKRWRTQNQDKVKILNKKNNDRYSYTERVKKNPRAYWGYSLSKYYGITLEYYDSMVRNQMGLCAICSEPGGLCVDHNHSTGKVRGLLCGNCNKALGLVKEDILRLANMIVYLKEKEYK